MDQASLFCANCSAEIAVAADGRWPQQCPACGELVVVNDEDETESAQEQHPADGEIEEAKIRRIVRDRRALVRTRTYYIVVLTACLVLAVQVAIRCVVAMRAGDSAALAMGWGAGVLLLLWIGVMMPARIRELSTRINMSDLGQPETPPDFSGLSDGSQHARNLDELGKNNRDSTL